MEKVKKVEASFPMLWTTGFMFTVGIAQVWQKGLWEVVWTFLVWPAILGEYINNIIGTFM